MKIANHALAGASLAIMLKNPVLAVPAAFASHFILDSLPHFGFDRQNYATYLQHKTLTAISTMLDILGVIVIGLLFPVTWLVAICAVVAVSPDFEWPYRYFWYERLGKQPPETLLTKFHQWLQWRERPWGLGVETIFFIGVAAGLRR